MRDRLQDLTGGHAEPKARGFGAWIAGRARRREYWLWITPLLLAATALELLVSPFASLLVAPPLLCAMIRRLHDLGRSGWFAPIINVVTNALSFVLVLVIGAEGGTLLAFLCYLAALAVLGALPGEARVNEYGPLPGPEGELAETFS
jgi:uncharacterized membrane protein YhaH (DUF805 family)